MPTRENRPLNEMVRGQHLTDDDVSALVARGYDEDEILDALWEHGHTIGLTRDMRNEWEPEQFEPQ